METQKRMNTTFMTSAIGANVERLRKTAGLTQQGLATGAGLSVSLICQIEQGINTDRAAARYPPLRGC